MRVVPCLVALAALLACASAGRIRNQPGCFQTDTFKKYKIQHGRFVDFTKGQFVNMAYIQARKRGQVVAAADLPRHCVYLSNTPQRACYNSVDPGKPGPNQLVGQYGFEFYANFHCPKGRVSVPCKARLDTLRSNRPGRAAFWGTPRVSCKHKTIGKPICSGSLTDCGGVCKNQATDPANCGSCGNVCAAGVQCLGGVCAETAVACNATAESGGAGDTTVSIAIGSSGTHFPFRYNAFSEPDWFVVSTPNGTQLFSIIAGSGSCSCSDCPGEPNPQVADGTVSIKRPTGVSTVSVRVRGGCNTAWEFSVGCAA